MGLSSSCLSRWFVSPLSPSVVFSAAVSGVGGNGDTSGDTFINGEALCWRHTLIQGFQGACSQ